jgi:quercetin dioxygenase-like cupin family protein
VLRQQVVEAGGGREYDWANDHMYVKTESAYACGQVTLVEDTLKPGFHLVRHYHSTMTEIFYILEGEVRFTFDDEQIVAVPGTTITVPPNVSHEVLSDEGARLLTVFSPGGFDRYLEELAALTPEQKADAELMQALAERYDTWTA